MRFVYAIGGLFALSGLYVGAYYAAADRTTVIAKTETVPYTYTVMIPRDGKMMAETRQGLRTLHDYKVVPRYRFHDSLGSSLDAIFQPVHWLDRKIRPGYWEGNGMIIP